MGRAVGVVTLIVVGVIIADALIHPQGVRAVAAGANSLASTTTSALLGKAPKGNG